MAGELCAAQIAAAAALVGLLTGCAFNYVGADGSRHVVGFMHVVLPPEEPSTPPASSIRTRTLGMAFTQGGVGSALSLGYSDITLAYVRGDTCVRWPLERKLP